MKKFAALLVSAAMCVLGATHSAASYNKPKGIVSFTFDDATSLEWNAYRILRQHGMRGTLFVTTSNAGTEWGLSWDQIREMHSQGWEIGAHSVAHPDLTKVDMPTLHHELIYPKQKIAEEIGVAPVSFASPFGAYDEHVIAEIEKHYMLHATAWSNTPASDGFNVRNATDPFRISRISVGKPTISAADVCGMVTRAKDDGLWLVLLFHTITPDTPQEYQMHEATFEEIAQCVTVERMRGSIAVRTLKEAFEDWSRKD
jgi:hypothetical protein